VTRGDIMMTARDIQKLLNMKHIDDVYVSECKNGSTWFSNHLRLDGLAIARSWANPMITGYEIKVSRSDFLRDQKMNQYTKYCNVLYLICPPKLIMPDEVPETIGLMWVASTGTRIYIKKKAPYREIDEPAELYKYILISRAKIIDYNLGISNARTPKEYWTEWLKKRKIDREFGYRVGKAIKKTVKEEIEKVQQESDFLRIENERIKDTLLLLEREGIDITVGGWGIRDQVREIIRKIKGELPPCFDRDLKNAIANLQTIERTICDYSATKE
jgi:hypothetical protein